MLGTVKQLRELALGALQVATPADSYEIRNALAELEATTANSAPETEEWKRAAAAAFEHDMMPVRNAILSALRDGDVKAWEGLKAILPHLLDEVNQSPVLGDLLAHQLGKALLEGFTAESIENAKGGAA
jgi:hypothetical protein